MKKAISVLLAVVIALSQLALCAEAATTTDNPLKSSDRITTQLAETLNRKQEIEAARIQRENAIDAAVAYGKTSGNTNDLSFLINRKTMTKREYEAFKWSFIISQFARPLQDSLLDVFNQTLFNSMIDTFYGSGGELQGVKHFLEYGGASPSDFDQETSILGTMLEDTDFAELQEEIKRNYSLLSIYTESGNTVTLNDLLSGSLAVFERLYVYDTIINTDQPDIINSLYYNQSVIGSSFMDNIEYSIETVKIPVMVYDSESFLFMQLAVGIWCKTNESDLATLSSLYGQRQIVMDSFGNICINTSEGAKIFLPNFGNGMFTNTYDEDQYLGNTIWDDLSDGLVNYFAKIFGKNTTTQSSNTDEKSITDTKEVEERINFYNKWITALYTRTTRSGNSIYGDGDFEPIPIGSGVIETSTDDDGKETTTHSIKYAMYVDTLTIPTNSSSLANSIILVDQDFYEQTGTQTLTGIYSDTIEIDDFDLDDAESLKSSHAKFVKELAAVLNEYKADTKYLDSDLKIAGSIYSRTVTTHTGGLRFAPSITPKNLDNYTIYDNPYPIMQAKVDLSQFNGEAEASNNITHAARYGICLVKGDWSIELKSSGGTASHVPDSGYQLESEAVYSTLSSTKSQNQTYGFLDSLNDMTTLVTTFTQNQIIADSRFITGNYSNMSNGISHTSIYLPSEILDVGQFCTAYTSDEPGMFLAAHYNYFSSDFSDLKALIATSLAACLMALTGDADGNTGSDISNWLSGTTSGAVAAIAGQIDVKLSFADTVRATITQRFSSLASFIRLIDEGETIIDLIQYFSAIRSGTGGILMYSAASEGNAFPVVLPVETTELSSKELGRIFDELYEFYDLKGKTLTITDKTQENNIEYTISLCDGEEKEDELAHAGYHVLVGETGTLIAKTCNCSAAVTDGEYSISAAFILLAICSRLLDKLDNYDTSISLYTGITNIAEKYGVNGSDLIYFLCMLCKLVSSKKDNVNNWLNNIYFFDEYSYYLRSTQDLDDEISSSDSMDFSTIMYFWDRYYLPKATFNIEVLQSVQRQIGYSEAETGHTSTHAYKTWDAYEEYLEQNYLSSSEYSYSKFLDNYEAEYIDDAKNVGKSAGLHYPYVYEFKMQLQSFDDYLEGSSTAEFFSTMNNLYNWLNMDTIILYPAYTTSSASSSSYVKSFDLTTYMPTAEAIATDSPTSSAYKSVEEGIEHPVDVANVVTNYNPIQLIMALQCNTDYEHNYLAYTNTSEPEADHVTKEELMDKANQFFDNPVTSLEYIMSGFLYKMHATIATGSLGSVFSANWLLESDVYKWIIDRYVAIVTILVAILLLIKLTQFAMSKTHNYASIGRSVVCILAMCMVPVLVFNSFIWVFNKSSQWALSSSTNKMLLSETNAAVVERINNDWGVTGELQAFREQFDKIQGEYDGITFEEMEDYSLAGPIYKQVPLTKYISNLNFGKETLWYTSQGFTPVHADLYQNSMFYYFYDYIKSEFYSYASSHAGSSGTGTGAYVSKLDTLVPIIESTTTSEDEKKEARNEINTIEQSLAQLPQEFISMLSDTDYVYATSIVPDVSDKYGGAYTKDLAGVYNLFQSGINKGGTITGTDTLSTAWKEIKNSPWRLAMNDAKVMTESDGINPRLWTDQAVISEYVEQEVHDGGYRGATTDGEYPIMTSQLDLYNSSLNSMYDKVDTRVSSLVLTPLEEKLCEVTKDIYDSTLKALEYHQSEIKNESAIVLMAWIATFKVSKAFGIEPAAPIPQTITLDTVIRTAFINDLNTVSSNTNTMYALIAQGDSIARVIIVLILETTVAVAGILRIFIILYLTVGSFVILALRLLHKAPQTTDLVYGIVFNILALLALHVLTLFLVVCAVEWVATATNTIPNLVLDIIVIAFIILMVVMLFKLVKNLVKDAINLGGAKIKAGIHSFASKVANMVTQKAGINSLASELNSDGVNLTANNVNQALTINEQQEVQVQDRRERIENTINNIEKVEESSTEIHTSSIINAIAGESVQLPVGVSLEDATNVAGDVLAGEVTGSDAKTVATTVAGAYGGAAGAKAAEIAMNTKLGEQAADTVAKIYNTAESQVAEKIIHKE